MVSWIRGSWGSQLMGLARAPARLVLRLARLVRLALRHLARRRFRLDHCHHVSAYGAMSVVHGRHSVWVTHGPREQRRLRGICAACAWQMRQPPAGRRPAGGQCLKHHIQLLTCKRVLLCESMGVAGEARARVLRACRVRGGRVCWCASAEQARGRGGGEGRGRSKPSARHASRNRDREKSGSAYYSSTTFYVRRGARATSVRRRSAECQLRRVIDTLAGLPSAIDTLTGATVASRAREPPPFIFYKAVVVLSQAQVLD